MSLPSETTGRQEPRFHDETTKTMARMPDSRRLAITTALATAILLGGCVSNRNWNPFPEASAPVLSPDATAEQVIAHLNSNIAKCTAWRCTDVTVKSNQMPLSASAMMAVESPRRFRMLVSAMQIDLADLGSNDERMWIWMRPPADAPSYIYTCSHTDLGAAQQRTALPFRPDWLMEVLGVMPIDPAEVEMTQNPGDAGEFLLRSEQQIAGGSPVVRIMTVDAKQGVIVNHALWNGATGELIAQAKLGDHRRDEQTGVLLPHEIQLSYPSADASMTLSIKNIEVNPVSLAENTWMPSGAANCPCRDLATGQIVTLDRE